MLTIERHDEAFVHAEIADGSDVLNDTIDQEFERRKSGSRT